MNQLTDTPIAFIGLGLMGRPMALRLVQAGYKVTVWNRTPDKMAPLLAAGATTANSAAEAASQAAVIFVMVTDAPQVRAVVLEDNGVIHGAQTGAIVIDHSSIAPAAAREIAGELEKKQIAMLDAPVSGGPEGAAQGMLSIMVGGKEAAFQQAKPLLEVLGKTVRYVGPSGMGQLFKLCNQVACAMNILGMAEALALAKEAGADPALVREVLLGGAAQSWMLENWAPKILSGDYRPGFTVANFQKDLRNVLAEAAALHLPMLGTALVHNLYRNNEAAGEAQESNVAIYKVLLRLAGEKI
jgi:3-hydroxyisobutyrate dehydrogenase